MSESATTLRLSPRPSVVRCAVCHEQAREGLAPCPACRTVVHPECAEAGCPTLGCAGASDPGKAPAVTPLRTVSPLERGRIRLVHWLVELLLAAIGSLPLFLGVALFTSYAGRSAESTSMAGSVEPLLADRVDEGARPRRLTLRPVRLERWSYSSLTAAAHSKHSEEGVPARERVGALVVCLNEVDPAQAAALEAGNEVPEATREWVASHRHALELEGFRVVWEAEAREYLVLARSSPASAGAARRE
ncbi:MAG: hypothetical protein AB7N76_36985 [Planctomycetota bacterium]